jgi:hypothetical protein
MTARALINEMVRDTKFADLLPENLVNGFRDEKKRDSTYATSLGKILGTKIGTPFGKRQLCVTRQTKEEPATWAVIERKRTVTIIILQTPEKDTVDSSEVPEQNTENGSEEHENTIFPKNSDSKKLSTLTTLSPLPDQANDQKTVLAKTSDSEKLTTPTTPTFANVQANGQNVAEVQTPKRTKKALYAEMDEMKEAAENGDVEKLEALAMLTVADESVG